MADDAASPSPSSRGSWKRRLWLGLVAVLVLVAGGFYVWKLVAVNQVQSAMEEQRDSLVRAAEERLDARTEELLRMSAVPLGFAVRQSVLDGNFGLVDEYLSGLVQEPGVRQALVVDRSDSILVATNRNLRGQRFSAAALPVGLLGASETTVRVGAGGSYFVAVPITGINRTAGTLVVEYRPEQAGPGENGGPEPAASEPDTAAGPSAGRPPGSPVGSPGAQSMGVSSGPAATLPAGTRTPAAPRSWRPS